MRLFIRSALTVAGLTLLASTAEAATTDANSSRGTADLSWSTRTGITGPTSDKLGGSYLKVQFSADLDPVKDPSKPLASVSMKNVALEATWNDDKTIQIAPVTSTAQDGAVHIEHTLAPHIKLFFDVLGFKGVYDYNAEDLVDDLPGSSFSYVGIGDGTFAPWAITSYGIAKVKAPALKDAVLVSKKLEELIGSPSNPSTKIKGTLSFNATTEPTFNYATKTISVASGDPITKDNPFYSMPTTDADFIEVPMLVKGELTYSGSLFGRPVITVTEIYGYDISLFNLHYEADALGVELPYSSDVAPNAPVPVDFPAQMVHIPLPNVKTASSLNVGSAEVGQSVTKQTEIKNTGELGAVLSIKSSDPQFKVTGDKVMKAKDSYQLDVIFTPKEEGKQTAKITVTSNDPNEPVQVIEVTGNGTPIPEPEPEEPTEIAPQDSGCGCRTAPAPSSYAGYGIFGLALAAMLRRRRR